MEGQQSPERERSRFGSYRKGDEVAGFRLSFDPADTECGVFFMNGGGRSAATRAELYTHIGTSYVDVEVPDTLPPGEYTMEIRTRPTNKDVRRGVYERKVKVETP